MSELVTIELPQEALERFRRGAGAAGKPLEQFIAERLVEAIPPLAEDLPPPVRQELQALEHLDDQSLRRVAEGRLPQARQRLYSRLLAKNSAGTISARERESLTAIGEEARRLTLKKAHAYLLLKWRGHAIPSPGELETSQ